LLTPDEGGGQGRGPGGSKGGVYRMGKGGKKWPGKFYGR